LFNNVASLFNPSTAKEVQNPLEIAGFLVIRPISCYKVYQHPEVLGAYSFWSPHQAGSYGTSNTAKGN
jgi:hypothetical protein